MNRIKTDFRNRLGQKRLVTLLRIGEEGPEIKDFDPDCYISMRYQDKVRRVSAAKPHNYQKKKKIFVSLEWRYGYRWFHAFRLRR